MNILPPMKNDCFKSDSLKWIALSFRKSEAGIALDLEA